VKQLFQSGAQCERERIDQEVCQKGCIIDVVRLFVKSGSKHGGKIRCKAALGKGSTFIVELPIAQREKVKLEAMSRFRSI
jgi:light-regulated signal transduction histidine kinase (bacteriophytochrome)